MTVVLLAALLVVNVWGWLAIRHGFQRLARESAQRSAALDELIRRARADESEGAP